MPSEYITVITVAFFTLCILLAVCYFLSNNKIAFFKRLQRNKKAALRRQAKKALQEQKRQAERVRQEHIYYAKEREAVSYLLTAIGMVSRSKDVDEVFDIAKEISNIMTSNYAWLHNSTVKCTLMKSAVRLISLIQSEDAKLNLKRFILAANELQEIRMLGNLSENNYA